MASLDMKNLGAMDRPSGRFDDLQRGGARGALQCSIGVAAQVKMRRAVAGAGPPWMTAEGNGLALGITAVRVSAIAALKFDQR